VLVDAAIVIESFAVALLFRFWGYVPPRVLEHVLGVWVFAALAFALLLYVSGVSRSGVYQNVLRYSSIYQDVQEAEALVVPTWVFRVASATGIAAGGSSSRTSRWASFWASGWSRSRLSSVGRSWPTCSWLPCGFSHAASLIPG
jgi:hypothetical protein